MKVKFKNGKEFSCTAPVEQKVFKNKEASGWLLIMSITAALTSAELDELISLENISEITFVSDATEGVPSKTLFLLKGYDKITSVLIRHSEEGTSKVEIQLTKGV